MHFLISIVFIGIAVGMWFMGQAAKKKALAAQSWPKIPGVITVSSVQESRDTSSSPAQINYTPVVRYTYSVAGVEHTGSHIGVGMGSRIYANSVGAQRALAAFPLGKTIDVLVNPANPDDAVLSATATMNMLFPIIFGVIGVVFLFLPI